MQNIQLLTSCDACNSWPAFAIMYNMTADHRAFQLHEVWFCYPLTKVVIYDNGNKISGHNFQVLLVTYNGKGKQPIVKNAQTNSIVKCLNGHQCY